MATSNSEMNTENELSDSDTETEQPKLRSVVEAVKHKSIEDQLSTITSAICSMQDIMLKKGFYDEPVEDNKQPPGKRKKAGKVTDENTSVTTVYHNAVQHESKEVNADNEITFNFKRLRERTSSEEQIDTSDEFLGNVVDPLGEPGVSALVD